MKGTPRVPYYHLMPCRSAVTHRDDERGVARTHERKGQSRGRHAAADDERIERRLHRKGEHDARNEEIFIEGAGACGDAEPPPDDKADERKQTNDAEKARLVGNGREDEVALRKGQEAVLLPRSEQPDPEEIAVRKRIQRLNELIALVLRRRPRIEEGGEAAQAIGLCQDEERKRRKDGQDEEREPL